MNKKVGVLVNAFTPLERENKKEFSYLPHFAAYCRLREWPVGVTPFGIRDARKVFHHNGMDIPALYVFLTDMQDAGMIQFTLDVNEKGRATYLHITVSDLDLIPEHAARITKGTIAAPEALVIFLRTFALAYRKAAKVEWLRTAQEVSLARRVLKACGDDHLQANSLVRTFFNMPLEQQPDELSFMTFYFHYSKLLASAHSEERWVEARAVGAKAARERGRIKTGDEAATEDARLKVIADAHIADGDRIRALRAAKKARDAKENAL